MTLLNVTHQLVDAGKSTSQIGQAVSAVQTAIQNAPDADVVEVTAEERPLIEECPRVAQQGQAHRAGTCPALTPPPARSFITSVAREGIPGAIRIKRLYAYAERVALRREPDELNAP
jgi:hypothetical protein